MFKKILSLLLYGLPVVFFVICYFLVVTSGEDIFQGANTAPDIWNDAMAAFNHSARLADMYAWVVVNFFNYTFSFGADTIFRIIDVVVAFLTFYFTTYIALGRRPKLKIKDALVFAGIFLMVFLTSSGVTLYGGFSKIHNYLFICIVSVIFGLVYFKDILGQKLPEKWWFALLMLIFGYIFGLTSSVTAVAFLVCLPVYAGYLYLSKQKVPVKKFLLSWRGASVLGVVIALFSIYVIGPGLAEYGTSEIYKTVCDYLALDEIFMNVFDSARRIILHNLFNFGRFLAPFAVVSVPVGIYALVLWKKGKLVRPKFSKCERNFLVAVTMFIVLHILALSQIYYFTRMVLPIYLLAVAVYFYVLVRVFGKVKNVVSVAVVFVTAILAIIIVRASFAVCYLNKVLPILAEIKNSDEQVYCVNIEDAKSPNLPYVYLGQEDFLVDWAMPQTIYDKTIIYCE